MAKNKNKNKFYYKNLNNDLCQDIQKEINLFNILNNLYPISNFNNKNYILEKEIKNEDIQKWLQKIIGNKILPEKSIDYLIEYFCENKKEITKYNKQNIEQTIKLLSLDKADYEKLNLKNSQNKYKQYIHNERLMPFLKHIQNKKQLIKKEKIEDILNKQLENKKDKKDIYEDINSIDTSLFFEKTNLKNCIFLPKLFYAKIIKDTKKNKYYYCVVSKYCNIEFRFSNYDLLMILLNKNNKELLLYLKEKYNYKNINTYNNTLKNNLIILQDYKNLQKKYSYLYKYIKSSIELLIFLQEEALIVIDKNTESYFKQSYDYEKYEPVFFTAYSYIAQKIYPEKNISTGKSLISKRMKALNFIGLVNIIDVFSLPNTITEQQLQLAIKNRKRNIMNFYSISAYKENLEYMNKRAKFAYENGLKQTSEIKNSLDNVCRKYEKILKQKLNICKSKKEYKNMRFYCLELLNLKRIIQTNYYKPTVKDILEKIRHDRNVEFLKALDKEVKISIATLDKKELLLMKITTDKKLGLFPTEEKIDKTEIYIKNNLEDKEKYLKRNYLRQSLRNIKTNLFYEKLNDTFTLNKFVKEKLEKAQSINTLYLIAGFYFEYPTRQEIDSRLKEIEKMKNNILTFEKAMKSNKKIKKYSAYNHLLKTTPAFSVSYKETEILNIYNETFSLLNDMYLSPIVTELPKIFGNLNEKLLLPFVNFSTDIINRILNIDLLLKKYKKEWTIFDIYLDNKNIMLPA